MIGSAARRWSYLLLAVLVIVIVVHLLSIAKRLLFLGRDSMRPQADPTDILSCYDGGDIEKPIPAASGNFEINFKGDQYKRFLNRVDILQVTAVVDNVVWANVDQVRRLSMSPPFIHVIVTPDITNCLKMNKEFHHVRCYHDDEVIDKAIRKRDIERVLSKVGPEARGKGTPWYFQQFLKLTAVASGLGGLGEFVKIMDGEVVQTRTINWFTEAGEEIFETCPQQLGDNEYTGDRYGALWTKLTGRPLVHDHSLVAHQMSVRQSRVRQLLTMFSPVNETWESKKWIAHTLEYLCDPAAVLGFSEYWYYASYSLHRFDKQKVSQLPQIRTKYACSRPRRNPAVSGLYPTDLLKYITKTFKTESYVVLENHRSRTS